MYSNKLKSLGRALVIMEELRERCPWDREQTFESLRSNTIEETFELTDAIASGDMDGVKEELGDLLLHILFYSQMGEEQERFDIGTVADALCDKLIFRHPHVYGDVDVDDSAEVIKNWEELKLTEKRKQERKGRGGVLGGVPRSLPAMVKAYRVGEKAAAAGFDWEQRDDVWDKVREELAEFEVEAKRGIANHDRMEEEMGDLFFALVNASRLYGIDPELALERCNRKFIERFGHIEKRAEEQGKQLKETSLDEMESYWQEAKKL